MALCLKYQLQTKILPSKEIEDKADDGADDNAGGDGKVKTKATPLNINIPRQMSQPRNSSAECE
jgi:hypothetical protein